MKQFPNGGMLGMPPDPRLLAELLRRMGKGGDDMLVHLDRDHPEELLALRLVSGRALDGSQDTVNPVTGLLSFEQSNTSDPAGRDSDYGADNSAYGGPDAGMDNPQDVGTPPGHGLAPGYGLADVAAAYDSVSQAASANAALGSAYGTTEERDKAYGGAWGDPAHNPDGNPWGRDNMFNAPTTFSPGIVGTMMSTFADSFGLGAAAAYGVASTLGALSEKAGLGHGVSAPSLRDGNSNGDDGAQAGSAPAAAPADRSDLSLYYANAGNGDLYRRTLAAALRGMR